MIRHESDGSTTFLVREPLASRVELVGAFDGWHEQRLPLRPTWGGFWTTSLDLGPGEYLFRYLVDGTRWLVDEEAHGVTRTLDGTRKSRLWRPPSVLDPDSIAA